MDEAIGIAINTIFLLIMRADQIRDYIITYSRCKLIVPAQHTVSH